MSKTSLSQKIEAAPDRVFEAFTDFGNLAHKIEAIQSFQVVTDGPIGVGTRVRETRLVFKRETTEEMVVTAFDPPHGYTLGGESCGAIFTAVHRFTPEGPDGEGTRVEIEFETSPVTFFAKVMSPLSYFMLGACRKAMEKDVGDMRRHLEGRTEAAALTL